VISVSGNNGPITGVLYHGVKIRKQFFHVDDDSPAWHGRRHRSDLSPVPKGH
jgi:hypothetical protein